MNPFASKPIPRKTWLPLSLFSLFAIGLFLAWNFDPTNESFYPKCPLHQRTGLHCPGCGTTRAVVLLARGEFLHAFRFNPLLFVASPCLIGLVWYQRRGESKSLRPTPRMTILLLVILVLYFVARNTPSPTKSWLAPPERIVPESGNPESRNTER